MRLPWKRRPEAPAAPRPNYTSIAVMEHDLLGIKPEPGTAAAAVVALRQVGTCLTHQPVETTVLNDSARNGMCTRCGRILVLNGEGDWVVA